MSALERLFNPAQRARLAADIPTRVSCRTFADVPSPADWAILSYAAERYRLPGARLELARVNEGLFTGTLLGIGRITGCTAVAIVIASGSLQAQLHAGVLGEAFVLEATSQGLGTCWVAGTYRKRMLEIPLSEDDAILSVIAVGVPAPGSMDASGRKRKPIERIVRDYDRWPVTLRQTARAVQLAPSAMNMQPWKLSLAENRFILDGSERCALDLGIALCHAELTLPPHGPWLFAASRTDPLCQTALKA